MAAWDFAKAWENKEQKNYSMATLYGGSAILGLAITAGFFFAWAAPIMIILVAAFVIVAILIELLKDNKLMEWLKRCYWGSLKA